MSIHWLDYEFEDTYTLNTVISLSPIITYGAGFNYIVESGLPASLTINSLGVYPKA